MNATDATRIATLYQEYQQPIYVYLNRLMHDRETAEDLCQETFIKAMRSWDMHGPIHNVKSWLYQIARNTAYDELRRRRRIRFEALLPSDRLPEAQTPALAHQVSEQVALEQAFERLPTDYRVLLKLNKHAGYSVREIAAATDTTDSAVKSRLFRARQQFRLAYDEGI